MSTESKHLEVESLTIKSPNSKYSISLVGQKDGVGIWLNDGTTESVAVYLGFRQGAVIGFYSKNKKDNDDGMPFALGMHDGELSLQVRDKDGKLTHHDIKDVIKKLS